MSADLRDTNHDGKVSFMEKVKGMLHHHHGATTSGSLAAGTKPIPAGGAAAGGMMPAAGGMMPAAGGMMPAAGGIMPAAGGMMPQYGAVCQDPNCPDNAVACNDPNCGHMSGFGGSNFHDSRDLNRDGHISTGERLASGSTGFGGSNIHDSRDLNRDGHISTGERLASGSTGFGGSNIHDSRDLNRAGFDDASRLRLHEEQLAVSKREVGAGAVDIHKRVKEENVRQTVPLIHQELAIERHALHGLAEPGARISSQDEIMHVPLYREELVTEKRVVPTEEVIVRKNELTENQTVGATLRSEYVEPIRQNADARDINRDGHVSMGEKFSGLSMNNADARDTNRDGHVSMGEKIKGAMGTNTTKAARG